MKKTTLSLLLIALLLAVIALTVGACDPTDNGNTTSKKDYLSIYVDEKTPIFADSSLDDVKKVLTVTLHQKDDSIQPVDQYQLEGVISEGVTELTVISGKLSCKFTIKVASLSSRRYVSFDSNGGSEVQTVATVFNSTIAEPKQPTREHYTFAGWYYYTKWDFSTRKVTEDITLIAKWDWTFSENETTQLTFRQENDYYCVSGCESSKTDIVIPSTYCDMPVKAIDAKAFAGCKHIEAVTLPDTLEQIGTYAFQGCTNLDSFMWGRGNNLKTIGDNAFFRCEKLFNMFIPEGVTHLGKTPFAYCSSLHEIRLPQSLTSIGEHMTFQCPNLKIINVNEENSKYSGAGNCLIEIATKTMIAGCANSVVPSDGSVTALAPELFADCEMLTSFVIPDTVTTIGDYAFARCYNLKSINIGSGVTFIGSNIVEYSYSLKTITYNGTMEQWSNISKKSPWKGMGPMLVIVCDDGTID